MVVRKILTALFMVLVSLAFVNVAFAEDGNGVGKLEMHISDPAHRNSYFVCIADFGCYSVLASESHKKIPIMTGSVDSLFTTNVFTRRMYPQKVPPSCQIRLHSKQTLQIYGKLSVSKSNVKINDLHCKVA